ncbi:MAG TPA: hypothetical protein ENI74_04420 [Gammaproteobacteria bacterium]|nr:hypothetical protein [Gammaproteobacteria bacterium]
MPKLDQFRRNVRASLLAAALLTLITACSSLFNRPAGTPADVDYAQHLWSVLQQERMVGEHARPLKPFIGAARPHGWVLEVDSRTIQVGGHRGFVVVKKNYNGDNLGIAEVERDRSRYLDSISVMFRREPGYDPDNQDWFWAQYKPGGQLSSMRRMGMEIAMAGRLIKGAAPDRNQGCIYCHSSAGGGDYIFYPDIIPPDAP